MSLTKLVNRHGAGGEGAGEKQFLQRPQLSQSSRLQRKQQSEDSCTLQRKKLPPPSPPPPTSMSPSQPPLTSPPLSPRQLPPPPSPPPQQQLSLPPLPQQVLACSKARHVPEYVANSFCSTRKEKRGDEISWPSGAGGEVEEIASAIERAYEYWNEIEKAVVDTGGRVCIVNWEAEHGRKIRRRPKRARVMEKGTSHQQEL